MSKVIMVTSFKGGVGKTTVSANLSMALARIGNKVVAVDCDLESRCLDIVLGLEDSSLYNVSDVLSGRCTPFEATVSDPRCENLKFIPAPAYYDFLDRNGSASNVSLEAVRAFIDDLRTVYDYVILDCPARPDDLYRALTKVATHAVVVSLHTAASIRAAEKTAMMLFDMSLRDSEIAFGDDGSPDLGSALKTRLIVNGFKAADAVKGIRPRIYDIVSKTSIKLLGVLPFDEAICAAQENGRLCYEVKRGKNSFAAAMDNVAARCCGENVLLLKNVKTGKSRSKLI